MHSSSGSNHYTALPYKLDPKPLCDSMNTDYRKLVMNELHPYSNFPYTEDENADICSMLPVVSLHFTLLNI